MAANLFKKANLGTQARRLLLIIFLIQVEDHLDGGIVGHVQFFIPNHGLDLTREEGKSSPGFYVPERSAAYLCGAS